MEANKESMVGPEKASYDIPDDKLELVEGEHPNTFRKAIKFISETGVPFKHFSHKPVRTSAEAAEERGVEMGSGAKALLVKYAGKNCGSGFALLVMSAVRKVSWPEVKQFLGTSNVSFAKVEEVKKVTGCVPGAVPPIGSLFGVKTLLDPSLKTQGDIINFNIGLQSQSITMNTQDYIKIENPSEVNFTSTNSPLN